MESGGVSMTSHRISVLEPGVTWIDKGKNQVCLGKFGNTCAMLMVEVDDFRGQ